MKTIKVSSCNKCVFSEHAEKVEICFHPDMPLDKCDIIDEDKILDNCPLKNNPVTIYYLPSN